MSAFLQMREPTVIKEIKEQKEEADKKTSNLKRRSATVPNLFSLENMKKEEASGIGLAESRMSTSERRRGRAEDVVGLRLKRGSSSNSVFTVLVSLAYCFFTKLIITLQ